MPGSDRLTITITGPQGSGKTVLAYWLQHNLPGAIRPPFTSDAKRLGPVDIIIGTDAEREEIKL